MNNKGMTLLQVAVVAALLVLLLALFVTLSRNGLVEAMKLSCANNLRQLDALGRTHTLRHPGEWPSLTDGGFWMSLSQTKPPLLEQDELEVLMCPVKAGEWLGRSHYRGPRLPPSSLHPGEVLGADNPGNHGEGEGGNILFKDGSVRPAGLQDPAWRACEARLFP